MITPDEVSNTLLAAERDRRPIQPFTADGHPGFDLDSAYAAQAMLVQKKVARGDAVVGIKLGLTSRAKQQAMGVADPLYGVVTESMLVPFGQPVDLGALIQPRVEPEIAFLLEREVPRPATLVSVLAATKAVFGAIDVLDSRYLDYRFALPDVVADNCSAGRFLLGPIAKHPSELVDLRLLGCVLREGGDVAATAAGAAVLGHPAASVAWVVNQMGARGQRLPAGSLVFSGGLTAPIPLRDKVITAEFDGLGTIDVFGTGA